MHHDRAIELLREDRLLVAAEVLAPRHLHAGGVQSLDRLCVRDPGERLLHAFERRQIALQRDKFVPAVRENALHDRRDEVLGEIHVAREVHPRHFRLAHPELGQVPAGLRFLGAERRAEAVYATEREGAGFHVELTGLRQVRLAAVDVLRLEQVRRPFARRGG